MLRFPRKLTNQIFCTIGDITHERTYKFRSNSIRYQGISIGPKPFITAQDYANRYEAL